jgi:O-antigen/teichoic acid export membrane protein
VTSPTPPLVVPPTRRQQVVKLLGRAGWTTGDQVLVSLTNMALNVLVARALSQEGFGAFAVAFAVYSLVVGGSRALVNQPLVVRFTGEGDDRFFEAARAASGAGVLLGAAAGLVTAVVGLFTTDGSGPSLIVIGILLPGLLLQDLWRLAFIAEGRPQRAVVVDAVWAVGQLGAVVAVSLTDHASSSTLLLAWGLTALVSGLVGGRLFGGGPRLRAALPWLWGQRDLLRYYLASFLSVLGANQLAILLIAAVGSKVIVGSLRAAQVVLGPLNLIGYALAAFATPEIARRNLRGKKALLVGVGLSAVLVVSQLAYGLLVLAIPDSWGELAFGATWDGARSVLGASLVGLVAIGAGFGASTLLVALGFAKQTFWTNLVLGPALIAFGLLGLQLGGAYGAALGLSLAQCVVTPIQWFMVVRLMRRHGSGDDLAASEGSRSS